MEDLGAEPIAISVKHGETTYVCKATDATKCNYKQNNDDSTWPKITDLTSTGSTMVFTGTNFYTIGYTASVTWKGFEASSVIVDSETQATATFDGGVPINTVIDQSR